MLEDNFFSSRTNVWAHLTNTVICTNFTQEFNFQSRTWQVFLRYYLTTKLSKFRLRQGALSLNTFTRKAIAGLMAYYAQSQSVYDGAGLVQLVEHPTKI